jgi:hypothetical protein
MRAFFADGVDKMHIPWAVEGLPTLLHLSLFLFFGGLVIFLFNIDQEVFTGVVWWIGLFSTVYGLITLLPLIRHNSPYYAPLSTPVWFLYASVQYLAFKALASFTFGIYGSIRARRRCRDLERRIRGWMSGGVVVNLAEETMLEQSSEIDIRILGWTITALGNDDSLEKFFEAIPGLFNSKLVKHLERDFPETLLRTFWGALDGFVGRTLSILSSNSVAELVKSRRVAICRDIMSMIPCSNTNMHSNLQTHFDQAPVSIESLRAMARWFTHVSRYVSYPARIRVAKSLASMQERDDDWIAFASDVCGLAADDLRENIAHGGDNVLLATLIDLSHRGIYSHELDLVGALTQFDIRHTLPGLQHEFCSLWNKFVQEARNQGHYGTPVVILRRIRHLYIALHQGTDAAPTAFSASTSGLDPILSEPSSYPLCDIACHRPDSTAHVSVPTQPGDSLDPSPYPRFLSGSTVPQQTERANIIVGPPSPSNPTITQQFGRTFRAPTATPLTNLVRSSTCPTDASPAGDVVAVLRDTASAATLSRPLEGTTQRDTDIDEILSTLAPVPTPIRLVLNNSSTSFNAGAATTSNPFPDPPVVNFSAPASPSPSVPPLPNAEFFALLSGMTAPRITSDATMPRLRARGLVNTGSLCFVNAVLQLLAHSPPFLNLFRELGDLKGQRGAGGPQIGGGAAPLVDATVRFFEEFVIKEKEPPPSHGSQQQAAREKPKEGEEENKIADSFEPTYMYDTMKEKRQLRHLLVRSRAT